jgi:hypothetical protein
MDTFISENEHGPGRHGVQWQFGGFTIDCVATDLSFGHKIIDFVDQTRANPACRDIESSLGIYRTMPEKSVDLSAHFEDLHFELHKIGEYDHGYVIKAWREVQLKVMFELHEQELDDFLFGLREFAG